MIPYTTDTRADAGVTNVRLGSWHACPVCFQVEASRTTDGVQGALVVLLGVTAAVIAGCAAARVVRRQDSGGGT